MAMPRETLHDEALLGQLVRLELVLGHLTHLVCGLLCAMLCEMLCGMRALDVLCMVFDLGENVGLFVLYST